MNLLVTGATGFLGHRLVKALIEKPDVRVTASARRPFSVPGAQVVEVPDLDADTDWSSALVGQQVVIHTAARAHIMRDESSDPLAQFRRINVNGTLNLARQAIAAGIKRFIFISSIKVNGEQTSLGQPFTEQDPPAPEDAYARSKWEAEQGLQQLAAKSGMELVIIRPPLVYGPGVKGNFARLIQWIEKGWPLPLGAVHNQRSLVAVDNLVDLIITCIDHPAAANQLFLAGDGQDLSTTELLCALAEASGRPSHLIPIPEPWLMLAAKLLGKRAMAQRLLGSLQVDIAKAQNQLGWTPPITVKEGLRRCFAQTD